MATHRGRLPPARSVGVWTGRQDARIRRNFPINRSQSQSARTDGALTDRSALTNVCGSGCCALSANDVIAQAKYGALIHNRPFMAKDPDPQRPVRFTRAPRLRTAGDSA